MDIKSPAGPQPSSTSCEGPSRLLLLPLELRQLIYSYTLAPTIILPAIATTPSLRRRSTSLSNSYVHPTFLNTNLSDPLIYGIANLHSRWRVPTAPFPPSQRHKVMTRAYCAAPLPHPLQLTCKQLQAEFEQWALKSGTFTFAFHRFDSLIRWIKGRCKGWSGRSMEEVRGFLQNVGSVILEMELKVILRNRDEPGHEEAEDGVSESQEPWFDAMTLLSRECPNLHVLGLHVDIRGPEIQVVHFGEAPDPVGSTAQSGTIASTQQSATEPQTSADTQSGSNARDNVNAPVDWPPGKPQQRANLEPTIQRLLDFAESFRGMKRCGFTVRAGHVLRNLAADPGDGSLWARSWEMTTISEATEKRIIALERGLLGNGDAGGAGGGVVSDLGASTRKLLAETGRDMHWY